MAYTEELHHKILFLLMEDSRRSHREMAEKLKVSPTTVGKMIRSMEESGILQGYTILVDWSLLGNDFVMCLQLAALPGADVEQVGNVLKSLPEIKQVFYTTGDMTFACYAVCKDNKETAGLMKRLGLIDGIEKVVCHTVLKQF